MDEDEMHPVVKLLLTRMKSHPEEFVGEAVEIDSREDRWWHVLREVREYGNKAERDALSAAIRAIKLQRAHEVMMDELCNGDERRRRQQEEYEYERTMMKSVSSQTVQTYGGVAPGTGALMANTTSLNHTITAKTLAAQGTLTVGKETLDETTISQIKKAIGL